MTPRKTLADRGEYLCMCVIFICGIECFIVLDAIGELFERQKLDNDLRRQFEDSEAKVALLENKLTQYSTGSNPGLGLPTLTP